MLTNAAVVVYYSESPDGLNWSPLSLLHDFCNGPDQPSVYINLVGRGARSRVWGKNSTFSTRDTQETERAARRNRAAVHRVLPLTRESKLSGTISSASRTRLGFSPLMISPPSWRGGTLNKITLRHFALINATALFLFVFSPGTANASGSPDQEGDIHPNLAADGVTSDDVALAKAAAACDKAGTRLVLPAGKILLTGAATVVLNHCAMMGVGAPAGDRTGEYGTTILLTSETVPPFQLETGWQISGINFYWPNQSTGKTPYPPLFSDGGKSREFNHGIINNIVIVNAYDGMTTTPGGGSGDVKISNSTMWAYHYLFNLTNTGDSWAFSNNRFTPGPLLSTCGFSLSCEALLLRSRTFPLRLESRRLQQHGETRGLTGL